MISPGLARSPAMLGFLLQSGADLNMQDTGKCNPLIRSIEDAGKTTSDRCVDREDTYFPHPDEDIPSVVKLLAPNTLDINAVDGQGITALTHAAKCREPFATEIVRILLAHGADPNIAKGQVLELPLCNAVKARNAELVETLLHAGSDVNAETYGGSTALSWALCENRCWEPKFGKYITERPIDVHIIKLLLDHGAGSDRYSKNGYASLPLPTRHHVALSAILDLGVDPRRGSEYGFPILVRLLKDIRKSRKILEKIIGIAPDIVNPTPRDHRTVRFALR
jgi:hypothetical protein